jgi:DNA-binding transcriptional LysR family regulator
VDEKDWVLLKTLSEEMNVTKTAARLYISQPALTYRIKQIEKEFGVSIITRGKKGVLFTTEGEYIVEYAIRMLSNLRETKDFVRNISDGVSGTIRIGVSSNFVHYKFPTLLKDFLIRYPAIHINVTAGRSTEIIQLLKKEEIQIGIVRGNEIWDVNGGNRVLIDQDPICIISYEKIDMETLPSIPRIDYKIGQSLKSEIDNWWKNTYKQPPYITMKVDQVETCKEMVKNELGYAIIPKICIKPNEEFYIQEISLNDSFLIRETWMYYRESLIQLSTIKAFVDFISATAHKEQIISHVH